jgi:hypothetical protein
VREVVVVVVVVVALLVVAVEAVVKGAAFCRFVHHLHGRKVSTKRSFVCVCVVFLLFLCVSLDGAAMFEFLKSQNRFHTRD